MFMGHGKRRIPKTTSDRIEIDEPKKHPSNKKKSLLKASTFLIALSTIVLFGKIIIDDQISGMENSINHLRFVGNNTALNMETSVRTNNEVKYIVMHRELLNFLNEKPEVIKQWINLENSLRYLSIASAYTGATGGLK
jgi:hypothetical protein